MKKLILASAIAAIAANSATAATIYEDKGLTFKMKGDWQIQLRDDYKKANDMDVEFDDLEIKNTVIYDLGNDLKAFGQVDFGFKDAADKDGQDNSELEEAYVGMQYNNFKVKVGKQDLASDEFGIEGAYETTLEEDMFDAISTSGDDVIRVEGDFDSVSVVFSHDLEAEGNDSENGEATDLFVGANFDALSIAAAYQTYQDSPSANDINTWGLSAEFDAGFATFGADYSSSEDDATDFETNVTNLVASFKASKTTKVALGYVNLNSDDNTEDADTWYANVSYKFPSQKNVKLFAEVSSTDFDDAAKDATVETDILAGMQIKF
ncbi:porin [uncultured Neptuniibacter sp.]|uniref:porin n=1 Tax=uncultured Neptuniibacter sp. TaxID=502143 RepID=UPI002602660F|nr:porin [uncultured Neptuniibacter sp.]